MKNYLLDASVVLAMIMDRREDIVRHVRDLTNGYSASNLYHIPFTKIEVSNVLVMSSISKQEVEALYNSFTDLNIQELESKDFESSLQRARELAILVGDTVYDALCHISALANDMTFITMDKKYFNKAKQYGNIQLIQTN